MKVGDIVVRAYAWPDFVSGIIIEKRYIDADCRTGLKLADVEFDVAWADNTVSTETDLELNFYEDALKKKSKLS